jgi:hypothetical protein
MNSLTNSTRILKKNKDQYSSKYLEKLTARELREKKEI